MEQIDSNQDGVIEHWETLAFFDLNPDGDPIAEFAIPIISLLMRAKEIPSYTEECNFSSIFFLMKRMKREKRTNILKFSILEGLDASG